MGLRFGLRLELGLRFRFGPEFGFGFGLGRQFRLLRNGFGFIDQLSDFGIQCIDIADEVLHLFQTSDRLGADNTLFVRRNDCSTLDFQPDRTIRIDKWRTGRRTIDNTNSPLSSTDDTDLTRMQGNTVI